LGGTTGTQPVTAPHSHELTHSTPMHRGSLWRALHSDPNLPVGLLRINLASSNGSKPGPREPDLDPVDLPDETDCQMSDFRSPQWSSVNRRRPRRDAVAQGVLLRHRTGSGRRRRAPTEHRGRDAAQVCAVPRRLTGAGHGLLGQALGVANAIVAALLSPDWKARTENVTEWWGALIFVLCFFTLAAMWARCGLRPRLQSG